MKLPFTIIELIPVYFGPVSEPNIPLVLSLSLNISLYLHDIIFFTVIEDLIFNY